MHSLVLFVVFETCFNFFRLIPGIPSRSGSDVAHSSSPGFAAMIGQSLQDLRIHISIHSIFLAIPIKPIENRIRNGCFDGESELYQKHLPVNRLFGV